MLLGIDIGSVTLAQPLYLWLLVVPGVLLALGCWRVVRRRIDLRRSAGERISPVAPRHALVGDLGFWLCVVLAASLCIVALARPQATTSVVRRAGTDFVMLQDGSASMYARDVAPDRWQRSVRFLRTFAEALSWTGERVALALFAHTASAQVRLTSDPNALFFFLDHLGDHSPFRLEDDPTWDTNIEEGLYWGLNLVAMHEELFGKTASVKAFVVISDGQAWSGQVAHALAMAREHGYIVHVVGVGTTSGALIPAAGSEPAGEAEPLRAVLDRGSLRDIARAGGGDYFELDRQSDRELASTIIASVQRRAAVVQEERTHKELYAECLFAAAILLWLGTLLLRDPTELWAHAAVSAAALLVLVNAFR
jgi:Ca-activated chloride channel family protein